ncbi:deaminase [Paenibacillus swuensis]|uniref:Deaminase n=1 Tax=Paenibacillus swuensis TaxID=1178515 RepID=A0A172TDU5_9BACL|nr:amidohydrolase [Paenibacillus swuensis]ANE45191.1 deaminase [Paenibacillus swuensis]
MAEGAFWLKNVLVETGFTYDEEGRVDGTETELVHLRIQDGVIAEIVPARDFAAMTVHAGAESAEKIPAGSHPTSTGGGLLPIVEGGGHLLLPSFIEKHVHLDKTLLGEPWRAVLPASGVVERCGIEKKVLAGVPLSTRERAESLLDVLLAAGSTHVRTHVDIYPEVGTRNLEGVQQALEEYRGRVSSEIVAFPQHGLLRSESGRLVREAMRQGAGLVGGVDPATVDGDVERSLQEMVEIAVDFGAGIDLHLHDPDYLGAFTIRRLAALTVEAGLQGKVSVSHAFGLGEVPEREGEALASLLAEAGITVVTSVPHRRTLPPVPLLRAKGVAVAVGSDNIFDTWQPFGNGDGLERAGRLAERFRWVDEFALSRALGYITGGVTPLNDAGEQVWPRVGDGASLVLCEASCSAEAVARRARRVMVFYRGTKVAGGSSDHD